MGSLFGPFGPDFTINMSEGEKTSSLGAPTPSSTTVTTHPIRSESTKRWAQGLPKNGDYYWDEPVPVGVLDWKKNKEAFPPEDMDLSSAWAVAVIRSNMTARDRHATYPKAFSSKYLSSSYKNKGMASKIFSNNKGRFHYGVGLEKYEFHGEEGAAQGLPLDVGFLTGQDITSGHHILEGHECVVQNTLYKPHQQTTVATASRKRAAETQENLSTTKQGKKREKKGRRPLGELRLPDSDEDVPVEEHEHSDLEVAQYKIQLLASAVEAEHRCLDAFVALHSKTYRLLKRALEHIGDPTVAEEVRRWTQEQQDSIHTTLEPANKATTDLSDHCPLLAQRALTHGYNGPTEGFIAWREDLNRPMWETGDNPPTSAGDLLTARTQTSQPSAQTQHSQPPTSPSHGQDPRAPPATNPDIIMSPRSPSSTSSASLMSPRAPLPEWERSGPFIWPRYEPSMFPKVKNPLPLPEGVPKFCFPKSKIHKETIMGIKVNTRQARLHHNCLAREPWDNILYDTEEVRKEEWEQRWKIKFVAGMGWTEWDDGSEGIRQP